LTDQPPNAKLDHVKRADVNRARKIQAIRELSRLLEEAISPGFTGTVAVEVSSRAGSLGGVCTTRTAWPAE